MSQQINLFNPVFRQQKKYLSSVTMLQALAIICLGCALLAVNAAMRLRSLQAQSAATDVTLAAKEAQLAQYKMQYRPRVRSAALGAEIVLAQQELTMLQNASETLARGGFGDSDGYSRYFMALARQRVDGLWLTGVTVAEGGTQIGVSGNVLQASMVPQYMARLAQEPSMKGKAFATLEIGEAPAARASTGVAGSTDVLKASASPTYLKFSLQSGASAPGAAGAPQ